MTQVNFRIEDDVKANAEAALKFYSAENIAELERRVQSVNNGTATLKEHELIEVED